MLPISRTISRALAAGPLKVVSKARSTAVPRTYRSLLPSATSSIHVQRRCLTSSIILRELQAESLSESENYAADRPTTSTNTSSVKQVYVGNLLFDITENDMRKEFETFGPVSNVKIIYDSRGLSKGFGYVSFEDAAHAAKAVADLNGQIFEGRRITVQYVLKSQDSVKQPNPPSKTLYIGNMSFEMTAKDLDELFKNIQNVVDVRVAIDRRTGQPRGFAHADFLDQDSAQKAFDLLSEHEVHGRKLKVDFSKRTREGRRMGDLTAAEERAEAGN